MAAHDEPTEPMWRRFVPWLCGLVAFAIAAKKLIGGYGDLGIYLDVAREFQAGGFDLCRAREASGPWVYPHAAALPFVLLESTLGDGGARWAWCAGMGVATALLLQGLATIARSIGGLCWWQWAAFGFLFQRCIAQNLSHGQLSLWVGTCVALGAAALVRGRDLRAGAWLGLAAALKVTPALFLLALPFMRRTRAALAMAATVAFTVFVLPWPFCGTDEHLRHLHDFWRTATASLHAHDSPIVEHHAGPSVQGTLDYVLQARPLNREGHTVHLLDLSDTALRVVKVAWSGALAALLLLWFWRARRFPDAPRLAAQAAAVTMAMSLFSPLLRVYHLAAALLPGLLFCTGPRGRRDHLWFAAAAALALTMTLRQRNLIGETLWRSFDVGGLHVALVLMCVWLTRAAGTHDRADGSPPGRPGDPR